MLIPKRPIANPLEMPTSSCEVLSTRFEADQPLLIISYFSMCFASAIFIISMLDLSVPLLYFEPVVSGLTIIFHLVVFFLRYRHRITPPSTPQSTFPGPISFWGTMCSCGLLLSWIVPLLITIYGPYDPGPASTKILVRNRASLMAVLISLECCLMALIAILFNVARRQIFVSATPAKVENIV